MIQAAVGRPGLELFVFISACHAVVCEGGSIRG